MKNLNEKEAMAKWHAMSESELDKFNHEHFVLFCDREVIARSLGADHPLPRLIENALNTCDPEELAIAKAAYDALPEEVINRMHHPWIGHPPPPGTREKLRHEQAPRLVGESMPGPDPVGCYLQIDATDGRCRTGSKSIRDENGYVFEPAIVYDLRLSKVPVQVQILEGAEKGLVLDLLKKVCGLLERDWDRLTDPNLYLREPEDPLPF